MSRCQVVGCGIGYPQHLNEAIVTQAVFNVHHPQWYARIVKVIENELAEILWVDHIQKLESVSLAPHHLLFAQSPEGRGAGAVPVNLPQVYGAGFAIDDRAADTRVGFGYGGMIEIIHSIKTDAGNCGKIAIK